ncbi:MAG: hypothetical protein EZS28_048135 [Streblomastix strix]|uniref:Uncharacterized protein n=1 Tax=Streblomastix strix TaxID=222440 RepID=A0A5J4TDL7_9EUKA|nr:MAG: hypothetical protein EZS28_048135 [Streblomastix strix]
MVRNQKALTRNQERLMQREFIKEKKMQQTQDHLIKGEKKKKLFRMKKIRDGKVVVVVEVIVAAVVALVVAETVILNQFKMIVMGKVNATTAATTTSTTTTTFPSLIFFIRNTLSLLYLTTSTINATMHFPILGFTSIVPVANLAIPGSSANEHFLSNRELVADTHKLTSTVINCRSNRTITRVTRHQYRNQHRTFNTISASFNQKTP